MDSSGLDSIVPYMEGYLAKRAKPKFCNWWRKYWFVLHGKTLMCFRNQEESKIEKKMTRREFLNFTKVHAVRPIYNSSSDRFAFEIITKKSIVILAAVDEGTRRKWIDALQSALQLSIISSPIIKEGCVSVNNKHQFFGNKEYSLSQPDLSNRIRDLGDNIHDHRSFARRRASLMTGSKNHQERFEFVEFQPTFKNKERLPVIADDRNRLSVYRCTAAEFFMSDQNVNWPSLSMDIQEEIFREIVDQHEEMKRELQIEKSGIIVCSEISTQTEFCDDSDGWCDSDEYDVK